MPIQNSSPSSAAQVVGAAAIFRLAVHGGASSLAVDAHQLSRPLHLPDYLNIFRQRGSGFCSQSKGKLDTQLVTVNAWKKGS